MRRILEFNRWYSLDYFIWSMTIFFIIGGFWNLRKILKSAAIPDEMAEIVTREPATRKQKIACSMGQHEWVARVDLGALPDASKVNSVEAVHYFFDFAAPVCKHCPMQLPPQEPQ